MKHRGTGGMGTARPHNAPGSLPGTGETGERNICDADETGEWDTGETGKTRAQVRQERRRHRMGTLHLGHGLGGAQVTQVSPRAQVRQVR